MMIVLIIIVSLLISNCFSFTVVGVIFFSCEMGFPIFIIIIRNLVVDDLKCAFCQMELWEF